MDNLIKKTISHYTILSQIGSGGMGDVYLAEDSRLGRKVALKVLPPIFTAEQERLDRFEQEARAASALNHPNIITIHDIGFAEGIHFIATEFVEGMTLREKMTRERIEVKHALDIIIEVASALSAAHGVGVVHRDVKPENIMVRPDGYIKLLDFGLAKLMDAQDYRKGIDGLTLAGAVMGSVHYMSPEQARGATIDGRSDIFSVGIILYEMISGRHPFRGESSSDVIVAILEQDPPPLKQYADAPAELHRILRKALRKDREERYQTAKDLWIDLKSLKEDWEFEARLKQAPILSVIHAIRLYDLRKDYLDKARGVVHAVDGISFDCSYGEIVGLLGPNGAGKTTTLRMLATVLKPTHGKATVAGFDIASESLQVRKKLGLLTGGTGLYGRLTPVEILRFFGRLHDMPADLCRTRIQKLVELFDMVSFQNSHCDKLSTGQKQRVNLARTLLHDPPVIILDEPTAGLDIISSKTILNFIRESKKDGKCILFSTHYLTEAEILCDRVAIIHNGKILATGSIADLKSETGQTSLTDVFFHLIGQYDFESNLQEFHEIQ